MAHDKNDEGARLRAAADGPLGNDAIMGMMREGGERLKVIGIYPALALREEMLAKAALVSSTMHNLQEAIEQENADPNLHAALTFVDDELGSRIVIGAVSREGGEVIGKFMNAINGLTNEQILNLIPTLDLIDQLVSSGSGEHLMDDLISAILDKGDDEGQDGPNASA